MSQATRSAAAALLALAIVLLAVAAVIAPQGTDDARRKITLGQTGSVAVSQPAEVTATTN